MTHSLLALIGLAVGVQCYVMPAARCPTHDRRLSVHTMCEVPSSASREVSPPSDIEVSWLDIEVPPGAMRIPDAEVERHPKAPDRAISIVAELRSNAALFAAFAFGALSLPNTLVVSESRVTSATSSLSTSRPVPDSDLLSAFVFLDAATLSCMLVCVVVSQQADRDDACSPVHPGCNPVQPCCSHLHPGCSHVLPGCHPMIPGCHPLHPGYPPYVHSCSTD